jgi:hypothetical protein
MERRMIMKRGRQYLKQRVFAFVVPDEYEQNKEDNIPHPTLNDWPSMF